MLKRVLFEKAISYEDHVAPVTDEGMKEYILNIGRMTLTREKIRTWRLIPVPFCPPQIPYELAWIRFRASAVTARRLAA